VAEVTQQWARVTPGGTQIGMVLVSTQYGLLALCNCDAQGNLTPVKYADLPTVQPS
jgi:hypothetical protein